MVPITMKIILSILFICCVLYFFIKERVVYPLIYSVQLILWTYCAHYVFCYSGLDVGIVTVLMTESFSDMRIVAGGFSNRVTKSLNWVPRLFSLAI